jgi:hypothetical protein
MPYRRKNKVLQAQLLSVFMAGAGVPEVNRRYCDYGNCDDVMRYTKEGMWEGESGKYMLYRAKLNPSKKSHWYIIWILNEDAQQRQINLYKSELDESGIEPILHITWTSNGKKLGAHTMPRVVFVPRKGAN